MGAALVEESLDEADVAGLCEVLRRHWRLTVADMHPNLRWHHGVLSISQMVGHHHVEAAGRGLLLMPSVFAHKPAPPVHPEESPRLVYPSGHPVEFGSAGLHSPGGAARSSR